MWRSLISLLTLPSHNKLQNNLAWKGPHGCQPPAKAEFQCWVRSPKPYPDTTELSPELEFAHNTLLWSKFLAPVQGFSCCNTWALLLALHVQPWDKPLFILLLHFGSSALCLAAQAWLASCRQLCCLMSISTAQQATRKVHPSSSDLQATFKVKPSFLFPFHFRRLAVCTADCSLLTALQPCRALLAWEDQHSAREQEPQPAARGPQGNCGTCPGVCG